MKACSLFAPALVTGLLLAVASPALEIQGFDPDQTVVYKKIGDVRLKLDVFLPPGHQSSDRRPAIVFFFGGGWNGGSTSQFHPHCRYLASRGMVAFSAEYRVKSRHQTSPRECVQDGKSAVRWIRKNAKRFGVDARRLAAGGGSAGGHVAAAAGTLANFNEPGEDTTLSARPDTLVLFNPVYDNGPGGYGHERVKDYWKTISPMHNLSKSTPPTIVFFGTKDRLVPVSTAQDYEKRLNEAGVRNELHLYQGEGHGFFNHGRKNNRYFDVTMKETARFLQSQGFLPKPK